MFSNLSLPQTHLKYFLEIDFCGDDDFICTCVQDSVFNRDHRQLYDYLKLEH